MISDTRLYFLLLFCGIRQSHHLAKILLTDNFSNAGIGLPQKLFYIASMLSHDLGKLPRGKLQNHALTEQVGRLQSLYKLTIVVFVPDKLPERGVICPCHDLVRVGQILTRAKPDANTRDFLCEKHAQNGGTAPHGVFLCQRHV